ncbi:MAG TPA: Dyp-type peroxidase [Nitrososphaeraceae archaeon]|nr:Dyp-type peroxidase [Nitrososphaeraceae archaeon]
MTPGCGMNRESIENRYIDDKRRQPGIAFPSARKQQYSLIIRLDLAHSVSPNKVKSGLRTLCDLIERIDKGQLKIEETQENNESKPLSVSSFMFTATLGFGIGFFNKLNIPDKLRPKLLSGMPDNTELGDPRPYVLKQTDLILQLCSSKDYVNRWVLEYSQDIYQYPQSIIGIQNEHNNRPEDHGQVNNVLTAIRGWASVVDIHYGFQRLDGRNLMGFYDGISNPDRLSLDDTVWIKNDDSEPDELKDGAYMVFQKIEHDLDQWHTLDENKQEEWVGRSKHTGLLLGTLTKEDDHLLAADLNSSNPVVKDKAKRKLEQLLKDQKNPDRRIFDDPNFSRVRSECPVWSHVRKANPRQEGGAPKILIYRRGYLFSETSQSGRLSSGLLFICYQKNIHKGFEFIKKGFLNNKNFPVPQQRKNFTPQELAKRHHGARFTPEEIRRFTLRERSLLGLDNEREYGRAIYEAKQADAQNTGREGLSAPSELGVYSPGHFSASVTMGGGYYFIPPIPHKSIRNIGQQFFAD